MVLDMVCRYTLATLVLALTPLIACRDVPSEPQSPFEQTNHVASTVGLSGAAQLPITNSQDPFAQASLPTYPEWTLVKVTASGQTIFHWNTNCAYPQCIPAHSVGDVALVTNPRGLYVS